MSGKRLRKLHPSPNAGPGRTPRTCAFMQQGEQNAKPENLHELKLPREKKGRTLFLPIKQFWLGIKRISSENLQPSTASQMLHPPNVTNTTSVKRSICSRVFSLRAEGSIWLVPLKRSDPWERR